MQHSVLKYIAENYFGTTQVLYQYREATPEIPATPDIVMQEYEPEVPAILNEDGTVKHQAIPEIPERIKLGTPYVPADPGGYFISQDGENWVEVVPGVAEWDELIAKADNAEAIEAIKRKAQQDIDALLGNPEDKMRMQAKATELVMAGNMDDPELLSIRATWDQAKAIRVQEAADIEALG